MFNLLFKFLILLILSVIIGIIPVNHNYTPEPVGIEIYIAVIASLVTAGALWLRWRRPEMVAEVEAESEVSSAQISDIEPV